MTPRRLVEFAEPDGVAVTLYTRFREVLASNLGLDAKYPDTEIFCQSLQANVWIVSQSGHDGFLPNPFQFVRDPTIGPIE
jgi:hypothetical protein